MSEFSKLAARIESLSEILFKLDILYGESDYLRESTTSYGFVGNCQNQVGAASQSMSTTTSATPDFKSQWAWRSTSSSVRPDKDPYSTIFGQQLVEDYDSVQKLRDEITSKIIPSCEHFIVKGNTKDALTDLPRFGIAMRAKITAASEKSQICYDLVLKLMEKIGPLLEEENERKRQKKIFAEQEEKDAMERQKQLNLAVVAQDTVSDTHFFSHIKIISFLFYFLLLSN